MPQFPPQSLNIGRIPICGLTVLRLISNILRPLLLATCPLLPSNLNVTSAFLLFLQLGRQISCPAVTHTVLLAIALCSNFHVCARLVKMISGVVQPNVQMYRK